MPLQLYDGKSFYLDPTKEELETVDLADSEKNDKGGSAVTMGFLPSRDQLCLFTMEGKMDVDVLSNAMESLTNINQKVFAVIRNHTMGLLKDDESGSKK